ncbi:Na/Pi cotransporter family protein [Pirellulaceae bacterium SH449]
MPNPFSGVERVDLGILIEVVGGIGLFLVGMSLMTQSLKTLAGDWMHSLLSRFTDRPIRSFLWGVVTTLLIQSSSATVLMTIGFVSAGMITFSRAIGILMGASLGTTGTGWIVASVGLKVQIDVIALPLVGLAGGLMVLGRGKWRQLGSSLAGFSLLFIGINTLKNGMGDFANSFDFARIPDHGVLAVLLSLAIGFVLTLVVQSSSAAMAATLTTLAAGAINIEQAATIAIGASIGTTTTGAMASLGAGTSARRTALAHVLFNLIGAAIGLILLPLFLFLERTLADHWEYRDDAISLAIFHTTFIGLSVVLVFPWQSRFASLIEKWVPDHGPRLANNLDLALRESPSAALETTRKALVEIAKEIFQELHTGLTSRKWESLKAEIEDGIERTQQYLEHLPAHPEDPKLVQIRASQLHAIDHLTRLTTRMKPSLAVRSVLGSTDLRSQVKCCLDVLELALPLGEPGIHEESLLEMSGLVNQLATFRDEQRRKSIEASASGQFTPSHTLALLDTYRWLDRVAFHTWKSCSYLTKVSSNQLSSHDEEVERV